MKKFASILLLAAAGSVFAIGESQESPTAYLDNIKVNSANQAAYFTLTSAVWGNSVYSIDLSTANAYGREMFTLAVSAINTGKSVSFTVDTVNGGSYPNCSRTGGTPNCSGSWGAKVIQMFLHSN